MKLIFCTNGSMRVLKTWATSGAGRVGVEFDRFAGGVLRGPRRSCPARVRRRPARRAIPAAPRPSWPTRRRSGISVPGHDGPLDQTRQFLGRRRRALEVTLHDRLVDLDDRFQERLADVGRIDQGAGRVGGHVERAGHAAEIGPLPQRHVHQHARLAEQLLDAAPAGRGSRCSRRPSC